MTHNPFDITLENILLRNKNRENLYGTANWWWSWRLTRFRNLRFANFWDGDAFYGANFIVFL